MSKSAEEVTSMNESNGVFEIVTGKNETEEHVFSVIVKPDFF